MPAKLLLCLASLGLFTASLKAAPADPSLMHDVLIRHGTVYDGSGNAPFQGDVAINDDRISNVGDLRDHHGRLELDARSLAVTPGFINMLSWATETLLVDGRSQ